MNLIKCVVLDGRRLRLNDKPQKISVNTMDSVTDNLFSKLHYFNVSIANIKCLDRARDYANLIIINVY